MKVHGSRSSIYSSLFQNQSGTDSDDSTPFTLPDEDSDQQTTTYPTATSTTTTSSTVSSISSAFWLNQASTSTDTASSNSTDPAAEDAGTSSTEDTSAADLLAEFAKLANMTPAEKIRDQYLKEHNLTEEQFAQLSPDEQKAINDQIADEIKQQLAAGQKNGSSEENETAATLSIA